MTLTVAKADLKKPARNKQKQNGESGEFDDDDDDADEESEAEETKVDLIQLVHDDNQKVAELFFQFSQAEEDDEKQNLFDQIAMGLKVHAQLVEELYYPLLPETAKEENKEEAEELVFEAEASNYVASMILEVLATMKPSDDYFAGKMAVLHCLAKEQVKREEKEMFEKLKAAESEIDFEEIGSNAIERKMELQEELTAKGKRSKARGAKASAKPGGKKAKSPAKKTASKASAKSAGKKKSPAKTKANAKTKAKTGAQSKKDSSKAKPGAKAKSGVKAKSTSRATAKSAKKPAKKTTAKKTSAKKTTSKRGR